MREKVITVYWYQNMEATMIDMIVVKSAATQLTHNSTQNLNEKIFLAFIFKL